MNGKLIVLEGLDGSGKATQAERLYQVWKAEGLRVRKVSFPDYESDSSALIKMYLNGEIGKHADDVNAYAASSFYAVDRYVCWQTGWKDFWESGGIVIADRYTTSNAVYQCVKLPRDQWDDFLGWLFDYEYHLLGIPEPDIVIYLVVDPEVSQILLTKQYDGDESRKDLHEADVAYLKRAQETADYCAQKFGWRVIQCCQGGSMRNMNDIQKDIVALFKEVK